MLKAKGEARKVDNVQIEATVSTTVDVINNELVSALKNNFKDYGLLGEVSISVDDVKLDKGILAGSEKGVTIVNSRNSGYYSHALISRKQGKFFFITIYEIGISKNHIKEAFMDPKNRTYVQEQPDGSFNLAVKHMPFFMKGANKKKLAEEDQYYSMVAEVVYKSIGDVKYKFDTMDFNEPIKDNYNEDDDIVVTSIKKPENKNSVVDTVGKQIKEKVGRVKEALMEDKKLINPKSKKNNHVMGKIDIELIKSMNNKNIIRTDVLRLIKSEIDRENLKNQLTEDKLNEIIISIMDNKSELMHLYVDQNKKEKADIERNHLIELNSFLPKELQREIDSLEENVTKHKKIDTFDDDDIEESIIEGNYELKKYSIDNNCNYEAMVERKRDYYHIFEKMFDFKREIVANFKSIFLNFLRTGEDGYAFSYIVALCEFIKDNDIDFKYFGNRKMIVATTKEELDNVLSSNPTIVFCSLDIYQQKKGTTYFHKYYTYNLEYKSLASNIKNIERNDYITKQFELEYDVKYSYLKEKVNEFKTLFKKECSKCLEDEKADKIYSIMQEIQKEGNQFFSLGHCSFDFEEKYEEIISFPKYNSVYKKKNYNKFIISSVIAFYEYVMENNIDLGSRFQFNYLNDISSVDELPEIEKQNDILKADKMDVFIREYFKYGLMYDEMNKVTYKKKIVTNNKKVNKEKSKTNTTFISNVSSDRKHEFLINEFNLRNENNTFNYDELKNEIIILFDNFLDQDDGVFRILYELYYKHGYSKLYLYPFIEVYDTRKNELDNDYFESNSIEEYASTGNTYFNMYYYAEDIVNKVTEDYYNGVFDNYQNLENSSPFTYVISNVIYLYNDMYCNFYGININRLKREPYEVIDLIIENQAHCNKGKFEKIRDWAYEQINTDDIGTIENNTIKLLESCYLPTIKEEGFVVDETAFAIVMAYDEIKMKNSFTSSLFPDNTLYLRAKECENIEEYSDRCKELIDTYGDQLSEKQKNVVYNAIVIYYYFFLYEFGLDDPKTFEEIKKKKEDRIKKEKQEKNKLAKELKEKMDNKKTEVKETKKNGKIKINKIKEEDKYEEELEYFVSVKGNKTILEFELPGLDSDDVDIDYSDNYIIVKVLENEEKVSRRKLFGRSAKYNIENVDIDKIEANMKNGLLTITIPKNNK